jgi:membrane protein YqaA with SNARE-associated domain
MRRLLAWVQGFAESLGGPGLFVIAYLDSSFLSFPQVCDALIVLLTVRHHERVLFYALTTTIGSVAGCYSLYLVGRKGGEAFLRKRFHERHVDRALDVFRRHGILSVLVPSLMPPPMPFKIFVLAAGVSRMSTFDFLVAVSLGRAARYFGIAMLALWKGQQALEWIQNNAGKAGLALATVIVLGATVYFWWKKRQRGRSALSEADPGPRVEGP